MPGAISYCSRRLNQTNRSDLVAPKPLTAYLVWRSLDDNRLFGAIEESVVDRTCNGVLQSHWALPQRLRYRSDDRGPKHFLLIIFVAVFVPGTIEVTGLAVMLRFRRVSPVLGHSNMGHLLGLCVCSTCRSRPGGSKPNNSRLRAISAQARGAP